MTGEIRQALDLLFPAGSVVEVRALTDKTIHSGYFDDLGTLAEKADVLETQPDVQGIYVTLNEVDPALLSRRSNRIKMNLGRKDATTGDTDIIRRQWLPVDLDPVRPSGVSSTADEHEAALARADRIAAWLGEWGFPEPVKADSGNGAHLLYRIGLPNNEDATALVKSCLTVLDTLFSDGAVTIDPANFNAARIWKLYGTTSRKGDNTSARPHRQSRIISVPAEIRTVPEEILHHLAGMLPTDPPKTGRSSRVTGFDLHDWFSQHGLSVRSEKPWQGGTLFVLDECPFSGSHHDGAFAIQFPNGAIFSGCHHASCGGGRQRWKELRELVERPEQKAKVSSPATTPQPSTAPPPAQVHSSYRDNAAGILATGDPLAFMLDVFNREHVGDRTVAECLIMSVASQSVMNTNGLHVAISGNSGKGKTHACNAMLSLLPEQFRLKGTVSNKALFYHPLQAGTVLLFDDVTLSEDLQEVLKASTANFREPVEHRTLTTDRQVRVCTIPERCVWWLAKVESPGDDQVMNRMLSVWIDDSLAQDKAVLEHMKEAAARLPTGTGEDQDVLTSRAMWEILKEQVLHIRIPFATTIHFSATHNRRNPGMLFDLIRCHTLLFSFQRSRDEFGSLIATRDDFEYARRLFLEITGSGGGQETKQTRNEAATLETMARMNLQVFTIKQLQEALGLSYHQTYRLLNGYSNRKGTYAGILDKCPAVSYIDATVAEDLYGVELKRREHYFVFDIAQYRAWARNAEIWLEENVDDHDDEDRDNDGQEHQGDEVPDNSIIVAHLIGETKPDANQECAISGGDGCSPGTNREILRNQEDSLHTCADTRASQFPGSTDSVCACARESGVIGFGNMKDLFSSEMKPGMEGPSSSQSLVTTLKNHNKSTSDMRRGQHHPLPGLLDHREFSRVTVDLGRCDICNEGKIAYRCAEKQVSICESCYARLMREWNLKNGVK